MKFYKLSESDLPLIFSLNESEIKVWCWLSVNLPFENSRDLEIDTSQLAEEIGISRRSVQRALKTIQENELFEVEFTKAKVKRKTSQMSPQRHRCRRNVINVAVTTQMSSPSPKTVTQQGLQNSKIIQTNSDLKDTTEEANCCVSEKFQEKDTEETSALEKFEDKLKVYGIHLYIFDEKSEKKNLAGFGISPNPKIATIRKIIQGMPEERAERAIAAFLAWLPNAKNVRCKYAAFASSLRENWET